MKVHVHKISGFSDDWPRRYGEKTLARDKSVDERDKLGSCNAYSIAVNQRHDRILVSLLRKGISAVVT